VKKCRNEEENRLTYPNIDIKRNKVAPTHDAYHGRRPFPVPSRQPPLHAAQKLTQSNQTQTAVVLQKLTRIQLPPKKTHQISQKPTK
jgi:hypothetical protein